MNLTRSRWKIGEQASRQTRFWRGFFFNECTGSLSKKCICTQLFRSMKGILSNMPRRFLRKHSFVRVKLNRTIKSLFADAPTIISERFRPLATPKGC